MFMKYYGIDLFIAAIAVVIGYMIGGFVGAWSVAVLSVVEVSLSFDNAVVNASILKNWGEVWRRRFLTWGILIAVFGMRLVFPLLIVGVVASLGPVQVIDLAINDPELYSTTLKSVHHEIAAVGCGAPYALGALTAIDHFDLDPSERLGIAMYAASSLSAYVSKEYDVISV